MGWLKLQVLTNIISQNLIKSNIVASLKTTNNNNSLKTLEYSALPMNSLINSIFKISNFTSSRFIKSLVTRKASNSKILLTFKIWIDFLIPAVTANVNPIFNKAFQIWIIIKILKITHSSTTSRIFWVRWKVLR
jgi:hypothetical protein